MVDIDNTKKLLRELKGLNKTINVGHLGGTEEENQMVKIGMTNEFGAVIHSWLAKNWLFDQMKKYGIPIRSRGGGPNPIIIIPERSYIRRTFDNKNAMDRVFDKAQKSFSISKDISKVVEVIGLSAAGEIQETMTTNIKPKNHPYTIYVKTVLASRPANHTLIDSGRLRQSVTYEVV